MPLRAFRPSFPKPSIAPQGLLHWRSASGRTSIFELLELRFRRRIGWVIGRRSAPFFRRGLEKSVLQSLKLRKSVDSNAFGENERSRDVVFGRHFDFVSWPGSVRDRWVRTFVTILLRDCTSGRVSSCSLGVLSILARLQDRASFQLQSSSCSLGVLSILARLHDRAWGQERLCSRAKTQLAAHSSHRLRPRTCFGILHHVQLRGQG